MAVSPVGSQIYVNQAAPFVSQLQQTVFQRFDLQAYAAAQEAKHKEPKIEEPTEADGSGKIKDDDGKECRKECLTPILSVGARDILRY